MKHLLTFIMSLHLLKVAVAQTNLGMPVSPTILRQGISGAKWIYTNLDAAVQAAEPDDILYLSGGTFRLTNSLNKKVTIFGTGYRSDSARAMGKSEIILPFKLDAGAGSSYFCAIHFKGNIETQSTLSETVHFGRCRITGFLTTHLGQFDLRECVVGNVNLGAGSSLTTSNSVFERQLAANNGYLTAQNCVFLGYGDSQNDYVIKQFVATEVAHSIFLLKNPFLLQGGTPNSIRNNLVIGNNDRIIGLDADTSNVRQPFSYRNSIFTLRHDLFEEASNYRVQDPLYSNKGIYSGTSPKFRATPPIQLVEIQMEQMTQNTINLQVRLRNNE
ncbi:MAG: hypothetical protein RIS64_1660 [Bacteroidota bacterium]|jgi:hypothetical protein